jgi:hypothetical protein
METKGAFIRVSFGMDEAGIIRASGHAGFATGALTALDQDGSAGIDMTCSGGTSGDARRILTVVAALGADLHGQVGKLPVSLEDEPVSESVLR